MFRNHCAIASIHRNVRGLPLEYVGARGTSAGRLAKRAEPPSAGGQMVASPSLPTPVSLLEAKVLFGPESASEASSAQRTF